MGVEECGMRKPRIVVAILLAVFFASGLAADQTQMSVKVKQTQVRATPSFLGKILGNLNYGDKVTVLDQPVDAPKGWLKVLGPDKRLTGWVNISALQQKEILLQTGTTQARQAASSGDVALAGKGFNSDVEAEYKKEQNLDYTWVDKMEGFTVPPQAMSAFITQGGLTEQGGAQ
jgi:uncharacterized protein YgiM (DUF1202 family)